MEDENQWVINDSTDNPPVINDSNDNPPVKNNSNDNQLVMNNSIDNPPVMNNSTDNQSVINESNDDPPAINESKDNWLVVNQSDDESFFIRRLREKEIKHKNSYFNEFYASGKIDAIVYDIRKMILDTNQTFLTFPNQSLSMEYKQLSCIFNMKHWVLIHWAISYLAESIFMFPLVCLFGLLDLFFHRFGWWIDIHLHDIYSWLDVYDRDRYSLMILVMKKNCNYYSLMSISLYAFNYSSTLIIL